MTKEDLLSVTRLLVCQMTNGAVASLVVIPGTTFTLSRKLTVVSTLTFPRLCYYEKIGLYSSDFMIRSSVPISIRVKNGKTITFFSLLCTILTLLRLVDYFDDPFIWRHLFTYLLKRLI